MSATKRRRSRANTSCPGCGTDQLVVYWHPYDVAKAEPKPGAKRYCRDCWGRLTLPCGRTVEEHPVDREHKAECDRLCRGKT